MSKMTPDRWQQLKELFDTAVELDPLKRGAFLDGACANDAALRAEVELLLKHHTAGSFLENPALDAEQTRRAESVFSEGPGSVIDKYKLLEKLGEGQESGSGPRAIRRGKRAGR